MSTVSVIVITYNEERNIDACLKSVQWADEIIVVDSQSTDKTIPIALQYTNKVYVKEWEGYSENKNYALRQVSSEWVLWIDADERVTPELAEEIKQRIAGNPAENGFECARRAFFLGKWIRHCGWYPGYVLRLFRHNSAQFNHHKVHEGLVLDGKHGRLKNDLLHFTDDSLEHYLWKFNRYTSFAAEELAERGKKPVFLNILFRPLHAWLKMYIFKLGFLDGMQGFMLCFLSAGYVAMKYAKLWENVKVNNFTQDDGGSGK